MTLSSSEKQARDLFDKAFVLHQSRQLDAAQSLYQQVLVHDPDHAHALHSLGAIAYARGRHSDAIELFQRAISLKADEVVFHHSLAQALRADGNSKQAIKTLREALSINPEFVPAWQVLAELQYALNETSAAAHTLRKVAELQTKAAESHNQRGIELVKGNRLQEGVAEFQAGIACNPNGTGLYYNLGNVLAALGRFEDAVPCLQHAAELDSTAPKVYVSLSNALFGKGDVDSARRAEDRARALDPTMTAEHFKLNHSPLFSRFGKQGAQTVVGRSASESAVPRTVAVPQAIRHALQLHQAGDLSRAAKLYRNILAAEPDNANTLHLLGVVAHQEGEHRRALKLIDRAIAIAPASASFYSNRALVLAALGDFDGSELSCHRALLIDPEIAAARETLSVVHRKRQESAATAARPTRPVSRPGDTVTDVSGMPTAESHAIGSMIFEGWSKNDCLKESTIRSPSPTEASDRASNDGVSRIQSSPERNSQATLKEMSIRAEGRITRKQTTELAVGNAISQSTELTDYANACALYEQGKFDAAAALCRQILEARPGHPDVLRLVEVLTARIGNAEDSVAFWYQARAVNPADPVAHYNLSIALLAQNRAAEALHSAERAVELKPDYAEAHFHRGNVLIELKMHAKALACFDRALEVGPGNAEAHFNRGTVLEELGRQYDALVSYTAAINFKTGFAAAHYNRGRVLYGLGRSAEAINSFGRALEIDPSFADAYVNRGVALERLRRTAEALADYEKATLLRTDLALGYFGQGNALRKLNRQSEALDRYDRCIAANPSLLEALINRGNALTELNKPLDALGSFDRALTLQRDCPQAIYNRSLALLLMGQFDAGWEDYEARWKQNLDGSAIIEGRAFTQPLWIGEGSLAGRTILLHSEQGLGDTIQFCRYVPLVSALGARVILEVQQPLRDLLTGLDGAMQIFARGELLPEFDCHCPLLSLPLAFKTTLANVPAKVPYLKADRERVIQWKERIGERRCPRIGLVWSGGVRSDVPELEYVNTRRNIPLVKLAPLIQPQIELYSLQKGAPAESELETVISRDPEFLHIKDFTKLLADFSHTAALIENLDLVISVDTSTAHLAGALGKPVWILNRFDGCWRWLLDRSDSPWYPTAKLYRQEIPGDWVGVIQKVASDLLRLTV